MITKEESLKEILINGEGVISYGIEITIKENGEVISQSENRTSITPDFSGDLSSLPSLVQNAVAETWTDELVADYKAKLPPSDDPSTLESVESSDTEAEPTEQE